MPSISDTTKAVAEKRTGLHTSRSVIAGSALFCTLALTGCLPGPKYHTPTAPVATAPAYKESTVNFQDEPGWKVANPSDAMLKGKWWEIYQQPELNALEDQLEINNQNIKVSFENFMAARAVIREAKAQYWPTVTTSPGFTRSRASGNLHNASGTTGSATTGTGTTGTGTGTGTTTSGTTTTNAGTQSSVWSLPLDISWSPDIFGKIRSQVRADEYAAQVTEAELENEKLLEQATLAEDFFELRGQDALQKILDDTIAADERSLALTKTLYDTGIDQYISVVGAQSTLNTAQSAALNLGVARAQYEHAIAMLIGRPATNFSVPVKPLLIPPPPIPTGVPAQLLQRRPDVAAAERTIAEANATIGIGYGAFFPDVTLSAAGGFESSSFEHWFDWPSRFWSIGPSLAQTIFNGGLYRAALNQYTAEYNADIATYRQTVLVAFQQVEDYLAATRILSQQVIKQQEAVDAEQKYLDLEMTRYKTGIDPYIDVMTAQTTLLGDQQTLATLQIQENVASIELVQALGGGWDLTELPSPSSLGAKPGKGAYSRAN